MAQLFHLRSVSTLPFSSVRPCRRLVSCVPACAATDSNDKRSNPPEPSKSWEEHLLQQEEQNDSYLPAAFIPDDIDAAKEKFLGRLATLILGATLLGERITGHGSVEQLEISATGVPLWEIEPLLGAVVLGLIAAALWPPSRQTPQQKKKSILASWLQNITGRAACLGLAATITGEVLTGKGALALLNVETGLDTVSEVEAIGAFIVLLLLTEDLGGNAKQ